MNPNIFTSKTYGEVHWLWEYRPKSNTVEITIFNVLKPSAYKTAYWASVDGVREPGNYKSDHVRYRLDFELPGYMRFSLEDCPRPEADKFIEGIVALAVGSNDIPHYDLEF